MYIYYDWSEAITLVKLMYISVCSVYSENVSWRRLYFYSFNSSVTKTSGFIGNIIPALDWVELLLESTFSDKVHNHTSYYGDKNCFQLAHSCYNTTCMWRTIPSQIMNLYTIVQSVYRYIIMLLHFVNTTLLITCVLSINCRQALTLQIVVSSIYR